MENAGSNVSRTVWKREATATTEKIYRERKGRPLGEDKVSLSRLHLSITHVPRERKGRAKEVGEGLLAND